MNPTVAIFIIACLVMFCLILFLFAEVMTLKNDIDEIKGNRRIDSIHINKLRNNLDAHNIKKPKK